MKIVIPLVMLAMLAPARAAAQPASADHGAGTDAECAAWGCLYAHEPPFVRPGAIQPEPALGIAHSRLPDGPDGRRFVEVLWPGRYDPARRPMWDQVAYCESTWRWAYRGRFHGGLQFHPRTWIAFGGAEYAPFAYLAAPEQQIDVAERVAFYGHGVHRPQGPGAWPHCGRVLRSP